MADRCLVPSSVLSCVFSTAVVLFVGCAADVSLPVPYDGPPEADGDTSPLEEALVPDAWEGMDFAARARFMSEVVMPTMRPLFVESDAERFATFSCGSCHGQGATNGSFAMPSPDLPVLGKPAAGEANDHDQRVTEFMRNVVKPKMAELLGQPELRCGSCHPSAS